MVCSDHHVREAPRISPGGRHFEDKKEQIDSFGGYTVVSRRPAPEPQPYVCPHQARGCHQLYSPCHALGILVDVWHPCGRYTQGFRVLTLAVSGVCLGCRGTGSNILLTYVLNSSLLSGTANMAEREFQRGFDFSKISYQINKEHLNSP